MDELIMQGEINSRIFNLRSRQIMLDADLAELYGVETKYLKRQVQRNFERFNEEDFMFVLSREEFGFLRSQIGTSNFSKTRAMPFAFTEQGVYMLATVINSPIAISTTKNIMRTFAKLREFSKHYNILAKQIIELDKKHDKQYKELKNALDELVNNAALADEHVIGFIK
ncbi:MAG: ORF6N domain-containing protein [Sulfurovaceae bacterium]|nr:ORF6N domain-containing protein [Sulfurovaceae bacterium]